MENKYSFIHFGSITLDKNGKIFTNVGTSELLENEISVFRADASGMPIVENIDQARLLAEKIGYIVYGLNGTIIGEGRSKEPIIKEISGRQIEIAAEELQRIIIEYLASKFEASGSKSESENQNTIYSFYDMNAHKHYLKYMGIRFD